MGGALAVSAHFRAQLPGETECCFQDGCAGADPSPIPPTSYRVSESSRIHQAEPCSHCWTRGGHAVHCRRNRAHVPSWTPDSARRRTALEGWAHFGELTLPSFPHTGTGPSPPSSGVWSAPEPGSGRWREVLKAQDGARHEPSKLYRREGQDERSLLGCTGGVLS